MLWTHAVESATVSTSPWLPALIGVGGVLAGAVGAGLFKSFTEQRARKAAAQMAALYDLQTAAHRYRRVLIDIGADDAAESAGQRKAYDKADSRLGIASDRVECETVRDHCEAWRRCADFAWRDVEEVTPEMERDAWDRLRGDVRDELRRYDA